MSNCVVMGGLGEVGRALATLLKKKHKVYILDKHGRPDAEKVDFLHVAIPYGKDFENWVKIETDFYKPRYTVIHSTVPVGTTRLIGGKIAHSPIRGQHNDKRYGFWKFIKYVGALDKRTQAAVTEHLAGVGLTVSGGWKPEETELAKLLCLSRYLNDLAFMETASRLCKRFRARRDVVTDWTMTYNMGYAKSKWIRPLLDFPEGRVGGHCVIPVSRMLVEQTENEWLDKNLALFR